MPKSFASFPIVLTIFAILQCICAFVHICKICKILFDIFSTLEMKLDTFESAVIVHVHNAIASAKMKKKTERNESFYPVYLNNFAKTNE